MLRRTAALAFIFLTPLAPGHAAEVGERTTYFAVRGSTLEEIDRDLQRQGPVVGTAGIRHPGATSVRFDGHVTYRSDDTSCRVDETHLSLRIEMMLPRWQRTRSATAETALIWRVLADDIARHEQGHADIARHWLRRMESALRNLRPLRDCAAMEASVNATTRRYLEAHERAQLEFDAVEGREVGTRLRRALEENRLDEDGS